MDALTLIIAMAVGAVLGAALVGWRASHAQRSLIEGLAAARAQIAEREASSTDLETRAKLFAEQMLKSQAAQLASANQANLNGLLAPLKTQFEQFTKEVSGLRETSHKESTALGERIKLLMDAQQKISHDAQSLTAALKGDNKMVGSWGEVILERVLEVSGLVKDREFYVQASFGAAEDQDRARRPDVVIQLPEGRFLIVDSKVSLKAYEEYFNCDDALQKEQKLKAHLASLRAHMDGLSKKNYQGIHGDRSPDFVMMFIPVEPAFLLATSADENLWRDGWNKHVLLVSPNTLLFVLRTVEYLWRQERLGRNAADIAERGAMLYDKFVGFVDDLESIGDRMEQANKALDAARTKLTGRGGLVGQAEKLKQLGVKPTKSLSGDVIERSDS